MKYNGKTRRSLQFKYAMLMVLLALALTALALPAVAQETDTLKIELINGLVVKSQPVATTVEYEDTEASEATSFDPPEAPKLDAETSYSSRDTLAIISGYPRSLYSKPASWTYSRPMVAWHVD